MNMIGAHLAVAWYEMRTWAVDVWRQRNERGLTTVEMAVMAVGLVIAAGILVGVIVAVVRSQTNELKQNT